MEEQVSIFQEENPELKFDEKSRSIIKSIASWAIIIVVVAVLGYIVSFIDAYRPASQDDVLEEGFAIGFNNTSSIGTTIFSTIVGLLMHYFLFRFAMLANSGVARLSVEGLTAAFRNLKIYFAIVAIIFIIVSLGLLVFITSL